MNQKLIGLIEVGEDRELLVTQIEAENMSFLRIGTFIKSTDTALSGVTFPPRVVDQLVGLLGKVKVKA